ncbi:MAG: electron transfer flavoprotein subunit beta/FixA family protein, partial [Chloroflexi bacterium]|nr:electron transfer flavoprotein subunit beta/FixA family protein [Chloroflexota bacterium]
MNVLVCVKRVPQTGGRIVLTPDRRAIDTKFLGFTVSPHEECGVEEAVRIVEANGGSVTVLTLGPAEAEDVLRDALAIGAERAILLETDGSEWDPVSTASAITEAVRAQEAANGPFDLIVFGNESADSGGFQVGIRVAVALDRPIATGLKGVTLGSGSIVGRREAPGGGWETYELALPAVVSVKEGINLPRYPSVPGRLRAKRKEIERVAPARPRDVATGPAMLALRVPVEEGATVEILGRGAEAAPAVVDMLAPI